MENLIIALIVVLIAVIIIWKIIRRYKTKEKFYQAVLSGNYVELLRFLMITELSAQEKICHPWYTDYIKRGLLTHFDSQLNVRVTSSRITRIEAFLSLAEKEAPHLKYEGSYWNPICEQLKKVISYCGPAHFASDYVNSLDNKEDEEHRTRGFVLGFYNECANSEDEEIKKQFSTFIKLVNQEIDRYQSYDITQERKDLIRGNKLSVKSNTTKSTTIWAI